MNWVRLSNKEIPVVILCGGKGTRLWEHTEFIPKPLVEVGGMPILWHIMKIYSYYGFRKFILCLGYKGRSIKQFFLDFEHLSNDFVLNLRSKEQRSFTHKAQLEDWEILFVDTGLETSTGGRLLKIKDYIQTPYFCMTYGDGVSDVDINSVIDSHLEKGKIATLTGINPSSQFGVIEVDEGLARTFKEKTRLEGMINGGFFVFNKEIFDYIKDDKTILELEPLKRLSENGQLAVHHHQGFWECMDTQKDVDKLNTMIKNNSALWMKWNNGNSL
jgi:glucose-1-phosphate cytidylyltransferase